MRMRRRRVFKWSCDGFRVGWGDAFAGPKFQKTEKKQDSVSCFG